MQDVSSIDRKGLWNLGEDADELGLLTVIVARPPVSTLAADSAMKTLGDESSIRRGDSANVAVRGPLTTQRFAFR